jgi:hypothetical protein
LLTASGRFATIRGRVTTRGGTGGAIDRPDTWLKCAFGCVYRASDAADRLAGCCVHLSGHGVRELDLLAQAAIPLPAVSFSVLDTSGCPSAARAPLIDLIEAVRLAGWGPRARARQQSPLGTVTVGLTSIPRLKPVPAATSFVDILELADRAAVIATVGRWTSLYDACRSGSALIWERRAQ